MKATGIVIILLALVIGIVPVFTDSHSQGMVMTMTDGSTGPMLDHWVGVAEIALAVPLVGLGFLLAFSKRKETRLYLSILAVILGAFVILLPTVMIGGCPSPMMMCGMVMDPALILAGVLTIAASLVTLMANFRKSEPAL
jgi:hypothetical protein